MQKAVMGGDTGDGANEKYHRGVVVSLLPRKGGTTK